MLVIVFLMLSYPLQVLTMSPLPSLIPYLLFCIIFVLHSIDSDLDRKSFVFNKNINMMLFIYIILFVIHFFWKLLFGVVTLKILISSIVLYVFPLLFYFYFGKYGTVKEFRSVLIAILICGIISGVYFVYDSYSMFILKNVNEYSKQVLEYVLFRQPDLVDPNVSRMTIGYRSHGLLEKHSISAAWISMGCFASLMLISKKFIKSRISIIVFFFCSLIVSLNYSALAAFIFIILFVEFKGYLIIRGRFSKIGLKQIYYSLLFFLLIMVVLVINFEQIFNIISYYTRFQLDLLFGKNLLASNDTFIGSIITDTINYPKHMLKFPPGILIGDGFSPGWGVYLDGGDLGLVETLHHLGLPFFIASIFGLSILIKSALVNVQKNLLLDSASVKYLTFAVSVILYLFITSIHYTTWSAKSIFPLFMIAIAIFPRFSFIRK